MDEAYETILSQTVTRPYQKLFKTDALCVEAFDGVERAYHKVSKFQEIK